MYVEWPDNRFLRRLEGFAHRLRKRLRLLDLDRLDPFALVRTFSDIVLFDIQDALSSGTPEGDLLLKHQSAWSALALREGGGPWLVTWNPHHAEVRIRASVMEEVAHIFLDHKPTKLEPDPVTGCLKRTFTPSKEKEAYGVAAAALLPYNGLYRLDRAGRTTPEIAQHFNVSEQLVQYRKNVTRLGARRATA